MNRPAAETTTVVRTKVRDSGLATNHSQAAAGGLATNHSQAVARLG
ncbi:hypothetical protein ABZS66_28770 [Dactylosporangium sp. NPDC005572]